MGDLKRKMAEKLGTIPPDKQAEGISVIPPGPMPHIENITVVPIEDDGKVVGHHIRMVTQNRCGSMFMYFTVEEFENFLKQCHGALDYAHTLQPGIHVASIEDLDRVRAQEIGLKKES